MLSVLKTAVYEGLGQEAAKVSDWEILNSVIAAQRQIAAICPAEMVEEILEMATPTMNSFGSGNSVVGLLSQGGAAWNKPYGCLQIVGVYADTGIQAHGFGQEQARPTPRVIPVREVQPREFWTRIGDSNTANADLIYMSVGSLFYTNYNVNAFNPVGGYATGTPHKILYKRDIQSPPDAGGYAGRGLLLNADTTDGDPIVRLTSKGFTVDYAADYAQYIGGVCVQGVGGLNGDIVLDTVVARILDLYDVDTTTPPAPAVWRGRVLMSKPADGTKTNSPILLLWPGYTSYANDVSAGYLNDRWDTPTVSLALSNLWLKLGDGNRSQLYRQDFIQTMQMLGVTTKENT